MIAKVTAHHRLAMRCRMCGAIHPLSHVFLTWCLLKHRANTWFRVFTFIKTKSVVLVNLISFEHGGQMYITLPSHSEVFRFKSWPRVSLILWFVVFLGYLLQVPWYFEMDIDWYVEINCQQDATDVFCYRSYSLLNMFRAPLCPSSGARDYYTGGCRLWSLVLGSQVVGMVWSWGLCVRFAGCSSSSTPYRQLENQAPKTTGGNQLYNTLELLMMGIMVPETCW
jgi:hypothetical protein